MLTRRRFVGFSAMSSTMLALPGLLRSGVAQAPGHSPLRLAVLGSAYTVGSNLQAIADRFLVGYPWDGDWHIPDVRIVSLYLDSPERQGGTEPAEYLRAMTGPPRVPGSLPGMGGAKAQTRGGVGTQARDRPSGSVDEPDSANDLSKSRSQQFGIRLCRNIPEALRCGGGRIAVDAVLTIIEQGELPYPTGERGEVLLPAFDFFQQCAGVFEEEGHVLPYFNYGQLSFGFSEAQTMFSTAKRLKLPLLGGSSMAVTWRLPDVDIPLGAEVQEAVMVAGAPRSMAFDALDAMQSMLERRKGGETGVNVVQLLEGDDVWAARDAGRWSNDLLNSALSRSDTPLGLTLLDGRTQDLTAPNVLAQLAKNPAAYCIEYTDGTRATLLMLHGAIRDFNISLRLKNHGLVSTQFFMTPAPNQTYSACLASRIEQFYKTRNVPYRVERNLLTTGVLDASMTSKHRLNERVETPHLAIRYQPEKESQYART